MTSENKLNKLKKDLVKKESLIEEKDAELEQKKREIQDKIQEIEEKDQKIEDYYSHLQRLQADFENYKKRTEKEMNELSSHANEKLIIKIIEIYEDLERSLNTESNEEVKKGVEIMYKKLKNLLEKEGLSEIPTEGQKFDPFKHEAVMTEKHDDYDNGVIIEELSKGYTLKSKIIKFSKVKVCKK